jgi:hypothetical protein
MDELVSIVRTAAEGASGPAVEDVEWLFDPVLTHGAVLAVGLLVGLGVAVLWFLVVARSLRRHARAQSRRTTAANPSEAGWAEIVPRKRKREEAGRPAACPESYRAEVATSYQPAARGTDLLYTVLHEHLATFLDQVEETGGRIARYARREVEDYLACGLLEHGFALLRCDGCGTSRAVGFSCKHRGFCPSCCGRRMNQGAAHLVDHVFPAVPVRQWVLSFPMPLRFRLAWDGELGRLVRARFLSTVFAFYQEASGLPNGRGGAVTFEQTFGSALNANLHFHSLVVDGVYVIDDSGVSVFHPGTPPTTADVQRVVDRVRAEVEALLQRRGLLDDEGEVALEESDDDAQRMLLAASVAGRHALGERAGATPRWLRNKTVRRLPERCAAAGYFNLHAAVRIAAQDRTALERLCRYVQRPPLSHDRLSVAEDGCLFLRFKRGWDDGTIGVFLTPHQLIARLVAIIPQPWRNLTHYHGVFAPGARGRSGIVPEPPEPENPSLTLLPPGRKSDPSRHSHRWIPWANLLFRVFDVDAFACPTCDGRLRVHAVVQGVWATRRVLGCLGLPSSTPRLWTARGPPAES